MVVPSYWSPASTLYLSLQSRVILLINFIYVFVFGCAGLLCCMGFSVDAASGDCSLVAVWASLVGEHEL